MRFGTFTSVHRAYTAEGCVWAYSPWNVFSRVRLERAWSVQKERPSSSVGGFPGTSPSRLTCNGSLKLLARGKRENNTTIACLAILCEIHLFGFNLLVQSFTLRYSLIFFYLFLNLVFSFISAIPYFVK